MPGNSLLRCMRLTSHPSLQIASSTSQPSRISIPLPNSGCRASLYSHSAILPQTPTRAQIPLCRPKHLPDLPSYRLSSRKAHAMATYQGPPHKMQDPQEINQLVHTLEEHSKMGKSKAKGSFSVKKHTFELPNGRTVDSWKMQDWDYKKPNLPTYARGLFTYKSQNGNWEIVVRGYDKFFNHGEVKKTEWSNVEKNTRGPYELSLKENGCIIFISGLDDGTLLVCSKHSTGGRADTPMSHSQAGEKWVDRQLQSIGRTRQDLARTLRQMNATAVAELCDDTFEEHVLAYSPEQAGLYLHGINLNLPEFATYPGHLIDQFATEWGFKKTLYLVEENIQSVKSFLDKVAETGSYAGRDTEGFVIRCKARDSEGAPWEDWFFKYKFEEPYLMYRQWRECTKALIAGNPPKVKKHKAITQEYLAYAKRRLANDPALAKAYVQNHGIIKLRDDFLRERGLKGSDIIRQEIESGEEGGDKRHVEGNVVLVPVATIGCGKTTVAVALSKLFGWGHVQNDNIEGKYKRPQRFAEAVCRTLESHRVMIADRNNHQKREREQIIKDVSRMNPDARFVALHYVHERQNYNEIRKVMQERVISRGDNHQTIQAAKKGSQEVIGIMDGFLERFQPVNADQPPDDSFDTVIDLDVTVSSRENLETVVAKMHSEYPKLFNEMPTATDLDNAIDAALNNYKPEIQHDLSFGNKNKQNKQGQQGQQQQQQKKKKAKPAKVNYFAVTLPSQRVHSILDAMFQDKDVETQQFYRRLQGSRRVQPNFHVTLIHRASSKDKPEHWQRMLDLHQAAVDQPANAAKNDPKLGKCKIQLERLVWDDRVMCFVVRLVNSQENNGNGPNGAASGSGSGGFFETVNDVAHVTVGTASHDIKPKESNDLLQRWLHQGSGAQSGIRDLLVPGKILLDGSVKAVLQRF